MNAYLLQRGRFNKSPWKVGIDSILKFDYMGSSEFEWGALPKSLSRIREKDQYTYLDIPVKDKVISVYCKESQKSEVREYLNKLAENVFHLQEYSDFDTYINPSNLKSRTDFWWDINNDLMFWGKNHEFEANFKKLIVGKKAE